MNSITELFQLQWVRASTVLVGALLAAFIAERAMLALVLKVVQRTKSKMDDLIVEHLRRPIFYSVILLILSWFLKNSSFNQHLLKLLDSSMKTIAILFWSIAIVRTSSLVFFAVGQHAREQSLVQPSTQPLFDIFSKLFVMAAASYGIMLAWNINVGAWLASAGIVGIALGFAAKDSLSNLFAGIFIVADAPYRLGDFIVLDGEVRGSVTAIGFRSTRLLTLDDIEIIVPNSLIGNARIVNESGGPHRRARVGIVVECAYGSDSDQVKEVLLSCAVGAAHVSTDPQAMVRFSSFGASGLVHELLVWIERPRYREIVVDDLNRRIYKAFAAHGIEIPYSKHDVFIKEIVQSVPVGSGASVDKK